jgi:hypothetical protein
MRRRPYARGSKVLDRLVAIDPRFSEVSADGEDGYWLYCAAGFGVVADGVHTIHEWTVKEVLARLDEVEVCECSSCFVSRVRLFELGKWTVRVTARRGKRTLTDRSPEFAAEVRNGDLSIGMVFVQAADAMTALAGVNAMLVGCGHEDAGNPYREDEVRNERVLEKAKVTR